VIKNYSNDGRASHQTKPKSGNELMGIR